MPLENIQKGKPDSPVLADIKLADVIDVPALQEMMDDYYALTGFGVGILDLNGTVLVGTGWQDICVKFHRVNPESCAFCRESDISLSSGVPPGTFRAYRCKNNMWDIAAPIMLGERHIGNIFLGQFFYDDEKPDYELFRAQARRFGFDEKEYLAALDRVPRWSRDTVQRAMGFYAKLAKMISRSNYNNVILADALARQEQAEEAQRLAKNAAEAATQAKSQFLANMSHELRTPMTGVLGMLDLALSGNLEAEQREFIELAQTSARSLVRILNDILDLTKIEMGKLSLEENPFSIRHCVQTALNILLPVAKTKELDLDFTVADDVPELLLGDQTRLNQVLTNLAGNAVKFTQKGQVAIRVAASGVTLGGRREVTFTVADTGIGIPNDKQHLLFQVFSQVNGSHSRSYGGSGLGLAISKELVERMGGAISCTSEEGKGSIFSFTLPFGEPETKRDAKFTAGKTVPKGDALRDAEMTKPRLLVAEDEPTIRQVLSLMLQRSNFAVDFAVDGEQVVEMWDSGHYDLILMDVQMPRMNGFEATAAIRAKEQTRGSRTPIVAMTAHALKEDEERCLVAGMDAYISKPIDFKKCLQVIAGIMRQKPVDR